MRFIHYSLSGVRGLAIELEEGGDLINMRQLLWDLGLSINGHCDDMTELIKSYDVCLPKIKRAFEQRDPVLPRRYILTFDHPISKPGKILCIGMNYADHCLEQDMPVPTEPVIYSKSNNCLCNPFEEIIYPWRTTQFDCEVQLAIVIGKPAHKVKKENAMDYVFGYTIANDFTTRDTQCRGGGRVPMGKSLDRRCPMGPALVTKDDIEDPHSLRIWTKVNGKTKQDSNTNQLVFKTADLIEFATRSMTLAPGDIILTGTPPSVGVFKKQQEFLKLGDVVEAGIEGIGTTKNKIVDENYWRQPHD